MVRRIENNLKLAHSLRPRVNMRIFSADTYIQQVENISYHNILPVSPFKPIKYNEADRFIQTLSTCEKTAFLDTKENIASLLPFVNDNMDQKNYLMGNEPLFSATLGWYNLPIRANYALKRLKGITTSGIYVHWFAWYTAAKSTKLFHHYANWKYPKFGGVSQLNYNSKIMAGFYIFGVCLSTSLIFLVVEILLIKWRKNINRKSSIVQNFEFIR